MIAAAKRARQIINEENAEYELEQDGEKPVQSEKLMRSEKPLSTAIRELMEGEVKILPGVEDYDDDFFGGSDAMGDVMYEAGEGEDYTEYGDDSNERYDEYDDNGYSDEDQDEDDSEDEDADDEGSASEGSEEEY